MERTIRKTFINNLKQIHDQSGLKQNHVSKRLGIAPQAMHYWRIGRSMPSFETIEKLADIYGIDWLEFFLPTEIGDPDETKSLDK